MPRANRLLGPAHPNTCQLIGRTSSCIARYGIIGSTEYAENNVKGILANAAAYLNVDSAASGPVFGASASPSLDGAVKRAASKVADPKTGRPLTDPDVWSGDVGPLGGGSDYAPFLNHLGIASVDFGFGMAGGYPVYHSVYDSFHWMEQYGDPGFAYHRVAAQLWGLLALDLSSAEVLPMNMTHQASKLAEYEAGVAAQMLEAGFSDGDLEVIELALAGLKGQLASLATTAEAFDAVLQAGNMNETELAEYNKRLALNERMFLSSSGLPKRPWYKNVLMASGLDKGYGAETLPGITQAIADKDAAAAAAQASVVMALVRDSQALLETGVLPVSGGGDDEPFCGFFCYFTGLTVIAVVLLAMGVYWARSRPRGRRDRTAQYVPVDDARTSIAAGAKQVGGYDTV